MQGENNIAYFALYATLYDGLHKTGYKALTISSTLRSSDVQQVGSGHTESKGGVGKSKPQFARRTSTIGIPILISNKPQNA